jgi:hypothetical protein
MGVSEEFRTMKNEFENVLNLFIEKLREQEQFLNCFMNVGNSKEKTKQTNLSKIMTVNTILSDLCSVMEKWLNRGLKGVISLNSNA